MNEEKSPCNVAKDAGSQGPQGGVKLEFHHYFVLFFRFYACICSDIQI
jgi:hypothetical protein